MVENKYYVDRTKRCEYCHPETCNCNDWAVYTPEGEVWNTFFKSCDAHEVAIALNAPTQRKENEIVVGSYKHYVDADGNHHTYSGIGGTANWDQKIRYAELCGKELEVVLRVKEKQ